MQTNLQRYKASVLKAACEGRLVPQEADLNPDYEPADKLLERILAERRRKWEEDEWQNLVERAQKKVAQSRRKAAGLPHYIRDLQPEDWEDVSEEEYRDYLPKNDKWKQKYEEPQPPDTDGLPELPGGWVWASFDSMLLELKNGYFGGAPNSEPPGIQILRINAVRPMSVDLRAVRYLADVDVASLENYLLTAGDLLFTRYNGNLHYVGICGQVPDTDGSLLYPDKLIRARIPKDLVLASYLELYFASAIPRGHIELRGKSTAGQHGISGADLKATPVSLPPYAEQKRIVQEVDRYLSIAFESEKQINLNLARASRLRQSILQQAFSGKLVPQDPDDEPAAQLLERIRGGIQKKAEKSQNNSSNAKPPDTTPIQQSLFDDVSDKRSGT